MHLSGSIIIYLFYKKERLKEQKKSKINIASPHLMCCIEYVFLGILEKIICFYVSGSFICAFIYAFKML